MPPPTNPAYLLPLATLSFDGVNGDAEDVHSIPLRPAYVRITPGKVSVTPAITPIRPVPHGDVEAARPTHVRITKNKWEGTKVDIGSVHKVDSWAFGDMPCIYNDAEILQGLAASEWEPAAPPAPVAVDTPRPRNLHGSLSFDVVPVPSAFDALLALARHFDHLDDGTVAELASERGPFQERYVLIQQARMACRIEGFR